MANILGFFSLMTVHFAGSLCGSNNSLEFAWQHFLSGNLQDFPEKPLKIYVGGVVETVAPLMVRETEFSVHMKLVLKWKDTKLMVQGRPLREEKIFPDDVEVLSKFMWIPCPYIANAKFQGGFNLANLVLNL